MAQSKAVVALIIFNRPVQTRRVVEAVVRYGPHRLFVIADGPRSAEEAPACDEARAAVAEVPWECEVLTNYSDRNLGCRARVSSGLTWVFEQCEEAIILEDDCVPHPSFFPFCSELLEKYRDDQRIMSIGGSNFQFGRQSVPYSYYFSVYSHVWGWATWRRAWRTYDPSMRLWPDLRQTDWLLTILGDRDSVRYWRAHFDSVSHIDTWAYPWLFSTWTQNGLAIIPTANLIANIGFCPGATHTSNIDDPYANIPVVEMTFPLLHPPFMIRDRQADLRTYPIMPPKPVWRFRWQVVVRLPRPVLQILRSIRARVRAW